MSFQDELEKLIIDNAILGVDSGQAYFVDLDQAVTSIINLVDKEVIGADEEENKFAITNPLWEARQTFKFSRDNLRDEQRAIIRAKSETL